MVEPELPYPPLELANRVGSLEAAADPFGYYDELGRDAREEIVSRLPGDWTFAGKRILDFGCGAGRTLRHFAAEAAEAEIYGSDIDGLSVSWLDEHLSPPFHVFTNGPEPPLDLESASVDLIWSISVFTHLTDSWSRWLTELHRVLKPDGLVYLTFMGRGMSEIITGEPWLEDEIGMNVTRCGQSWDLGGPMVMHAPWWIEEHWGRAFEILSLVPDGFASETAVGQGSVLMRKRDTVIDPEILELIQPGDAREAPALRHNVSQLAGECVGLRAELADAAARLERGHEENRVLESEVAELNRRLAIIEGSKSWGVTRPLRDIARRLRSDSE